LQGLFDKAKKINTITPAKMATLEAIILHKHSKHKSELPVNTPLYSKNEDAAKKIESILSKYPQHKRILFLKSKSDNNEVLAANEIAELDKFYKLLIQSK